MNDPSIIFLVAVFTMGATAAIAVWQLRHAARAPSGRTPPSRAGEDTQ